MVKINPFKAKVTNGNIEINIDIAISLFIRLVFALNRQYREAKEMVNIVRMLDNSILRFSSPVILAISSVKNTEQNPAKPSKSEAVNHLLNVSIKNTPSSVKLHQKGHLVNFSCKSLHIVFFPKKVPRKNI